jgi:uncharacterized phage infection (PIP) family protein YhgE
MAFGIFGIDRLTKHVEAMASRLEAAITELAKLERKLDTMPTEQELQTAVTTLQAAVLQAVSDGNTRVTNDLNALKQQIANNQPVTQADLDGILATQNQIVAAVQGIDPANPTPAPTP